jgi:WD40 repeat protein
LYTGNNNLVSLLGDNIFAIGPDGREVWSTSVDGSVAASPLLTPGGTVVVGGFDGFVRAYDAATGDEIWSFGTRDHIYASPGLLPDGTIVQPSADGTVYCLDPATGDQIWAFDTREPLRSSPAIDAEGNVYLGSGEGRLFVINASGTLRWAMSLIEDDRNDLNSSPALGFGSVVVAGESGQVFSVPLDYCLRDEAADDARCTVGPDEDLPDEGAFLYFTSALGGTMIDPPDAIEANQVLAFSLFVRESGDTTLALIDSDSVNLAIEPATDATIRVSGDRRFITVVPVEPFTADAEGNVTITITGRYLIDLDRDGLAFSGGVAGGNLDETFTFALAETAAADIPLPVPTEPGEASGVWEVYRLAAPLPTILPSYNQIGFDQLRYLVGLVEGTGEHAVGWFVGGRLVEGEDRTVVDPGTLVMVPFEIVFRDGLLTLSNQDGMSLNVMNADLAFDSFLVSAHVDETGTCTAAPQVHVETNCQEIELYGAFLERLGFCNPSTHLLTAFGTALIRPWAESPVEGDPDGLGEVELSVGDGTVVATLTGSTLPAAEHLFGILLIDAATGRPVTLDYPFTTERGTNADGTISSVTLTFPPAAVPDEVRAYLMIDTYPAARATLSL